MGVLERAHASSGKSSKANRRCDEMRPLKYDARGDVGGGVEHVAICATPGDASDHAARDPGAGHTAQRRHLIEVPRRVHRGPDRVDLLAGQRRESA